MSAKDYFQSPQKEVRCPTLKDNGFKCSRILGDFPSGTPKQQNFFCPHCRTEWFVEMGDDGILIFENVDKGIEKKYDIDTLSVRLEHA